VPGTGNSTNGIVRSGDGISKYNYEWPALAVAPRFGAAYDVSGRHSMVVRGGVGLFYDRPDGDSIYYQSQNPPTSTHQTVRNGMLQSLGAGTGAASSGMPTLINYRYDNPNQYQNNGANVNLTGSPDYAARVVINGATGSGCSGDRFHQSPPRRSPGRFPAALVSSRGATPWSAVRTRPPISRSRGCSSWAGPARPSSASRCSTCSRGGLQRPSAATAAGQPDQPDEPGTRSTGRMARSIPTG
jgi:hypothetical protein